MRYETFAPLAKYRHAFTVRDPVDDTRSDSFAADVARSLGFTGYAAAEQPHGNAVALIDRPGLAPGVDALVTRQPGLPLIIRCADCAPVFIVDQQTPAIALIHSGKKGTLTNIVGATLEIMRRHLGTPAHNAVSFIGPCIGPCHYEMDLRLKIEAQLRAAGIGEIHSPPVCTACHLDRYYSYRAEKGQTGRMFALLAL